MAAILWFILVAVMFAFCVFIIGGAIFGVAHDLFGLGSEKTRIEQWQYDEWRRERQEQFRKNHDNDRYVGKGW